MKDLQTRGTQSNPHPKPSSIEEFHEVVKPGQFFINPKDGKVYQRKSSAPAPIDAGGAIQPPNFMSPTPDYMTAGA